MGRCKTLKSIFKLMDTYSDPPRFNINGETNLKTVIGGILTFFSNFFFVAIFLYNLVYFITSNEPNSVVTRQYRNISEFETLQYNLFNITTFMVHSARGMVPVNFKASSANFSLASMDLNNANQVKLTPIGYFKQCSEVNEPYVNNSDISPLFKLFPKDVTYCSEFSNQADITLGGDSFITQSEMYISGNLVINLCDLFGKNNCTSINYLNNISSQYQLKLATVVQNAYTNLNLKEGFSNYFETPMNDIDLSKDYSLEIKVTKNIMETDINPLYDFLPPDRSIYYTLDMKFSEKNRSTNDGKFNLGINIYLDNYEYKIIRTYLKLDAMLANVMSITQMVSMLCMYLNYIYSTGNIEYEIFSKAYDFSILPQDDDKIKVNKAKNLKSSSISNFPMNNLIEPKDISKQDLKFEGKLSLTDVHLQGIEKLKAKLSNRKIKRNKFLLCYVLFPCLFNKQSPKNIILDKASFVLRHEMDIINILRRLIILDNMKHILLSDYQTKGLLMLKSRIINEKVDEKEIIKEMGDNCKLKLDDESMNYYAMVYEYLSNSEDEIDKRLFAKVKSIIE
jgi:hypothetical protein